MPRKTLFRSNVFPYHVTARVNNREPFPCSPGYVWRVICNELRVQEIRYSVLVHSLVLMPNHFHLLVTTPKANLDVMMREFMGSTTRIINTKTRRSGHLFVRRYHWSSIKQPNYFAHAYKYVYRNPVEAALSKTADSYSFTTLRFKLGLDRPLLKVQIPRNPFCDLIPMNLLDQLDWLNHSHSAQESECIQKCVLTTQDFSSYRRGKFARNEERPLMGRDE